MIAHDCATGNDSAETPPRFKVDLLPHLDNGNGVVSEYQGFHQLHLNPSQNHPKKPKKILKNHSKNHPQQKRHHLKARFFNHHPHPIPSSPPPSSPGPIPGVLCAPAAGSSHPAPSRSPWPSRCPG